MDAAPEARSGDPRPVHYFLAAEPGAGAKTRLRKKTGGWREDPAEEEKECGAFGLSRQKKQ
jgi:hypothetical protein